MNTTAGFVTSFTKTPIALVWTRMYQVTWLIGYFGGALVYFLITLVAPPPGGKPYVKELLDEHGTVTEGQWATNGSEDAARKNASSDVIDIEKAYYGVCCERHN